MTSVRLPDDIETKLDKLCAATHRSKSFYIKEALANYLDDIADYSEALDRVLAPKRKLLSTKEMIKAIESRS